MKVYLALALALVLVGCSSKPPSGLWVQGASRCEILPDKTLLFAESKTVQENFSRYGKSGTRTASRSTLYIGEVELGAKESRVTVQAHNPKFGGQRTRDLQLEWHPQDRQLKVDGQIWSEKPLQAVSSADKELCGWWKKKNISHWMLFSPGGTQVQIGSEIWFGHTLNRYSGGKLTGNWSRYELFQGKMSWKNPDHLVSDPGPATELESPYSLKGDQLTLDGFRATFERVPAPFHLHWGQAGDPQIP